MTKYQVLDKDGAMFGPVRSDRKSATFIAKKIGGTVVKVKSYATR